MRLPAGLSWRPEFRPQHAENTQAAPRATKSAPPPSGTATSQDTVPGTQQPAAKQQQDPCGGNMMLMLPLMFLVVYFMMIRPGQKQEKALKSMRTHLKKGDRVVTTGGMHAVVESVSETTVTLTTDLDGKVQTTFDISAVGRVTTDDPPGGQSS